MFGLLPGTANGGITSRNDHVRARLRDANLNNIREGAERRRQPEKGEGRGSPGLQRAFRRKEGCADCNEERKWKEAKQ